MRIVIILLASIFSLKTKAQATIKDTTNDRVFTVVQVESEFPGGRQSWIQYLQKNLNADLGAKYIPIAKREKTAKQTVMVVFIVDKAGNISNVQAEGINAHPKLIEEAIRVIKEGPNWTPAVQNGRNVTSRKRQAITWVASKE
jgi:protein TonB